MPPRPLYEGFKALREDGAAWAGLTAAQRRTVDNELRDFVLGGVALQVRACVVRGSDDGRQPWLSS